MDFNSLQVTPHQILVGDLSQVSNFLGFDFTKPGVYCLQKKTVLLQKIGESDFYDVFVWNTQSQYTILGCCTIPVIVDLRK